MCDVDDHHHHRIRTTTTTTLVPSSSYYRRRRNVLLSSLLSAKVTVVVIVILSIQTLLEEIEVAHSFSPNPVPSSSSSSSSSSRTNLHFLLTRTYPSPTTKIPSLVSLASSSSAFDNVNDDEDDDDDDDDYIDTEGLGDWRTFRRALAMGDNDEDDVDDNDDLTTTTATSNDNNNNKSQRQDIGKDTKKSRRRKVSSSTPTSVSKDNEEVLRSQNEELANEYTSGVWAHETATPEVGGLVVRMPLEVELYRNHRHSLVGRKLKKVLDNILDEKRLSGDKDGGGSLLPALLEMSTWYARAKQLVEDEMVKIAGMADTEGQIDATQLKEEASEMLSLYLDNQETWQEVCLVIEHAGSDEESSPGVESGSSTTLVLNRPMAFQLTENLGRLVLLGAYGVQTKPEPEKRKDLKKFMMAFANECAVYVGGPDEQGNPAVMIHGISDLPGAVEISPGTKIYKGGIPAAIDGVISGKYNPLEFRFFFGCHKYEESALDVAVHLGKYQPVACARSVALKQCISLPKPLWHEVTELCGGDLADLSSLEILKRNDLQIQVVDETKDDDDDDEEVIEIEIEIDIDDDDDDNFLQ